MQNSFRAWGLFTLVVVVAVSACAKKIPPTGTSTQPPPVTAPPVAVQAPPPAPAPPPQRVEEAAPVPLQAEDAISGRSLDDLNRDSPLQAVYFPLDGFELDEDARRATNANAAVLRKYPTWMITIEGHCDERGTAEYNLALGERRAVAVRAYLTTLGIPANRLLTVSYGEEFPSVTGHADEAWAKNRRANFVITAK